VHQAFSHQWQHEPLFDLMRVTAFALSIFPNILQKLNQIECWFSILGRRLLKRSNLTSTEDLQQQILDFIDYFHRTLAKPFV
jgi:hypothetical protein